jgi:pimeloyl-ACP methyl ester carboxylesterase
VTVDYRAKATAGGGTHVKICFFHLMPYRKKRLQRIAAPTLIHWGTDDRVNPGVCGEEFTRRIRSVKLERLPGGHMLHLESVPAVAAATTAFFSSSHSVP